MLNTFIIWQSGFPHLSQILWEISLDFEVKHAEKIIWPKNEEHIYLTKIYPNRDFDPNSYKVKEIGGNELIVILAVDPSPKVIDQVNQNTHNYKKKHRIKGINYLHASDDEKEALFNFAALTGRDEHEFLSFKSQKTRFYIKQKDKKNTEIKEVDECPFKTIEDVFERLNTHENWAILRNWEGLPEQITLDGHEDIDILTEDYYRTCALLKAEPFFHEEYRVHNLIKVGGGTVPFDIRFIGDHYYDEKWEKSMLEGRRKEKSFYRLKDEDYFWSLLYHAVFHKEKLSEDYQKRLLKIGDKKITSLKEATNLLKKYLKKKQFKISKPLDQSVKVFENPMKKWGYRMINHAKAGWRLLRRKRCIDLSKDPALKELSINTKKARLIKRNVYETSKYIIKKVESRQRFLMENEATILDKLKNYDCFPKVKIYEKGVKEDVLILEKVPGKDIFHYYRIPSRYKKDFSRELNQILDILQKEHITHRDIRPHNLIFNKGKVGLVDFQFALYKEQPLKTNTPDESYMLASCEKNLGGRWNDRALPLSERDRKAANLIIQEYVDGKRPGRGLKQWVFERVMRYLNYK